MHNTIVVKILQAKCQLVGELSDALLAQVEVPLLQVVEKIGPLHKVQHDVVVFAVLEQIDKVDNVGMLAHFEHLDLSSLLENLNIGHILFLNLLNSDLLLGLLVSGQFNQTKLALTQGLGKVVKVRDISDAH